MKYIIFIVAFLLCFVSCDKKVEPDVSKDEKQINFDHFDHLYDEFDFKGKKVGIIHIYSQFPDYSYAIEPNEGFTCVDDVARAIVLLSNYYELSDNKTEVLEKMKKMTEFILQMQNANGYFNNFIWNDLTINTSYQTSVAELNWWSFRALWALESAYPLVKSDQDLSDRISSTIQKLVVNIKRDIPTDNLTTEIVETIKVPTYLPQNYAADQAAVLIIGLLKTQERTADNELTIMIDALAKGVMIMQKGDAENYPYGAFLSWGNLWHAWGNSQAYALLKVGQQFNNLLYIESALKEIDNFYPYLLDNGFAEAFWIKNNGEDKYFEIQRNIYPQIAYGLRPMVWAASEAYKVSKDEKYLNLADSLKLWLSGENDAKSIIYNPANGICFDGIVSPTEINKNSGAESTIESLLIAIAMKQ